MVNDPIADMLTRIRNANMRRRKKVEINYSKLKHQMVEILLEEGYILNFKISGEGTTKILLIFLKYRGASKVIMGLRRISKPGLRVYLEAKKMPKVLNGYGIAIVSTSKGLMTSQKAQENNLGGEVLAYIW